MIASNQLALPVLGYLMWTQQWPITDLQQIDRKARKIVVENGGRHPCGSNALLYLPRSQGAEAYVRLRWNIKPRRSRVQLDSTVMKTRP